jgi:hypothetical protein
MRTVDRTRIVRRSGTRRRVRIVQPVARRPLFRWEHRHDHAAANESLDASTDAASAAAPYRAETRARHRGAGAAVARRESPQP